MSAVDAVALVANTDASDAELVEVVRAGDEEAFEELFRRYHARVRAFVARRVADHGRAEELTQDVFVSALRHLRATRSEIAFKPWLFQIARNATIDLHRRSSLAEEVPVDKVELVGSDPPETEVMARERLAHLQGAFEELNEVHHRALVMRELEGRSYREIGKRLSLTQAGVEGVLFRARRRLAKEYRAIRSRAAALLPLPLVLRRFDGSGRHDAALAGHGSNLLSGHGGPAGAGLVEQAAALVTAAVLAATGAAVTDRHHAPGGPDTRPAAAPRADGDGQTRTEILGHRPRRAQAITDGRRSARRPGGRNKKTSTRDRAAKPKAPSRQRSGSPGSGDAGGGAGLPPMDSLGITNPAGPSGAPSIPHEAPPLAAVAPALPDPQPRERVTPLLEDSTTLLEAVKGSALSG
jgi:RNA polymerase sigma factor (sigma-70 family)